MNSRSTGLILMILLVVLMAGCGGKTVTRIDPTSTTDLSGEWNDTDSRMVAEEMIGDVHAHPWLARYEVSHDNRRPTVIVGTVRNNSSEHIDTKIFTKDLEKSFINRGRVRVVAMSDERDEVRGERRDQQDFSDPATVKEFGKELGADYMMIGAVRTITDQEGGKRVTFYQSNLELIDIQTNEKVWIGEKEIKKYIGKGKYKG